ncbi:MAG: hypothetical protein ACO34E_19765 [Limisphaerales bacterium]|jgi:outer membrane murein-binding lipoprotein Lpp
MAARRTTQGDRISERAKSLNTEIADLEAQIRQLGSQLDAARTPGLASGRRVAKNPTQPDSSAKPRKAAAGRTRAEKPANPFETDTSFRKPSLWARIQQTFKPQRSTNPKLINYLAAGSIQGLRPLRYEKRIARNRVITLSLLLLFVIWGLIAVLQR